jgi:hypothetical protein
LKIEGIEINSALKSVKERLGSESDLSPAFKSAIELLLVLASPYWLTAWVDTTALT